MIWTFLAPILSFIIVLIKIDWLVFAPALLSVLLQSYPCLLCCKMGLVLQIHCFLPMVLFILLLSFLTVQILFVHNVLFFGKVDHRCLVVPLGWRIFVGWQFFYQINIGILSHLGLTVWVFNYFLSTLAVFLSFVRLFILII